MSPFTIFFLVVTIIYAIYYAVVVAIDYNRKPKDDTNVDVEDFSLEDNVPSVSVKEDHGGFHFAPPSSEENKGESQQNPDDDNDNGENVDDTSLDMPDHQDESDDGTENEESATSDESSDSSLPEETDGDPRFDDDTEQQTDDMESDDDEEYDEENDSPTVIEQYNDLAERSDMRFDGAIDDVKFSSMLKDANDNSIEKEVEREKY